MVSRKLTILMPDDDLDDFLPVRGVHGGREPAIDLRVAEDREELTDYLRQESKLKDEAIPPRPCLILLDLNMPKMNGEEALREIRADPVLRHIPVVVSTTSNSPDDISSPYRPGAGSFVVKPASYERHVSALAILMGYWVQSVEPPDQCE
jgi:CheY-like chemotaxis protein